MTRTSEIFMPFRVKLYSIYSNWTGVSYNSDENSIFQNSGKLSPVFKNIHDSLFTPIILITKLSNTWMEVNTRTSNSHLRHMCVLSTRTYPKRSKRTTSYTRITMWSHLNIKTKKCIFLYSLLEWTQLSLLIWCEMISCLNFIALFVYQFFCLCQLWRSKYRIALVVRRLRVRILLLSENGTKMSSLVFE